MACNHLSYLCVEINFLRDSVQIYSAVFERETLKQRAGDVLNLKYLYLISGFFLKTNAERKFGKNGYNNACVYVS